VRRALAAAVVLTIAAGGLARAQGSRFYGEIEVRRIELPVRVLDERGEILEGLRAEDLEVVVDSVAVVPDAVEWQGAGGAAVTAAGGTPAPLPEVPLGRDGGPSGRLLVCFFQLDFGGSRAPGLMRMARRADELIATLTAGDRMAVLVFGSHFQLHLDFTADRARLTREVRPTRLYSTTVDPAAGERPSLLEHLDASAARRAALPESALLVVARALAEIPGAKTLIFFGWGLGRFSRTGVHMERDYGPARDALARAQTSVFTLDVTEADAHSLEVGLQQVARETGGFYARTHDFPDGAIGRLQRALAGHYLVVFESPVRERGRHSLEVRLTRRQGRVLARSFFED